MIQILPLDQKLTQFDTDTYIALLGDSDTRAIIFKEVDELPPFAKMTLEEAEYFYRYHLIDIYRLINCPE